MTVAVTMSVAVSVIAAADVAVGAAASPAGARPGAYGFAPGARSVTGAADPAEAVGLEPGRTYRGSIPRNGRLYYRLDLAATTTAYVPVTAVPPAGTTVTATDGIRVSVQDAHGGSCSFASARFGAGLSPRPVTALGRREAGKALCQGAGPYYVLVERLDAEGPGAAASAPQRWDLEIAPVTEPRLTRPGPTTAPRTWSSASPEPLTGKPADRSGGTGFAWAGLLGQGVWRTALAPGGTAFFKVPVDWGRHLQATAELGAAPGRGYVGGALNLSLYNPARGYVDDAALGYTGTERSATLDPLPPVEYANRYAVIARAAAMRFAGDYYLVVHLSEQLAGTFGQGPFPVTLRVRIDGQAHAGPGYAGRSEPGGVFTVTEQDREAAMTGGMGRTGGGDSGGDDTAMMALAVGGIGTGSALLLVLGGWTVAARRPQMRARAQKPTA
ncbi:hypothetical protein [Streptomyces sp. NK08204]|uniref:hypothetical protein n=1 Tax=Streptomyces sp. NK08204 TaxID=2873260 RepID=UPI001CECDD70|nr:hypothetical protein [Streptomyces sp. NK08204]